MKSSKFILTKVFFAFILCLTFSCNENTIPDTHPDQLFRPVSFTAGVNGNEVRFSWVPIANASYLLEISKDSLLFQNDLQHFSIDGVTSYTVDNLLNKTVYSARIKAVSKDSTIKNSEFKEITFITQ